MFLSISLEVIEVRVIVKKGISEHCCVFDSKLERWSDSDCLWSALKSVDSSLEEIPLDAVSSLWGLTVKSEMSSITSHVAYFSGLSSNSL